MALRVAVVALAFGYSVGSAAYAGEPLTFEKPQPLKASLLDGSSIGGTVTRFDDDGFDMLLDGTPRRFKWEDFRPLETYRVRKRLIDAAPKEERLGRTLDLVAWCVSVEDKDATQRAERDAKALGADDAALVTARTAGAQRRAEMIAKSVTAAKAALKTTSPEAASFDPALWGPQTPADRDKAVSELKVATAAKLAGAGRELTAIESRNAIVYSDLGAEDAAVRGIDIDRFVRHALPRLGIDQETQPFLGKVVVIVVDGDDRFRLLEASAFQQAVTPSDEAFTHYDGGKAYVVVRRQIDVTRTAAAMYRAIGRAILHRHVSAVRLPTWANEGVVDWLVAMYPPAKSTDAELRKPGLAFVRNGGSIEDVLRATYDSNWPGANGLGRNVGFLLAGLMAEQEPARFQAWLKAVKNGKPWAQALTEDFGFSPQALADFARRYYRTND
ncbi:MAG: hypothetical protein JNM94_00135 [Phycisphaerae bacterium]|nr:hypothetical protein [Phycisphaerae bacterium]